MSAMKLYLKDFDNSVVLLLYSNMPEAMVNNEIFTCHTQVLLMSQVTWYVRSEGSVEFLRRIEHLWIREYKLHWKS